MKIVDGRGSFFLMDTDIVDDYENFTMHEVLAYMVLCRCANNETSKSFPSYNTIAKKMRVSRPTAIKAINGLVEKKVIHVEKNKKEDGNNESNIYTVLGYKKEKAPTDQSKGDSKNTYSKDSICKTETNNTVKAKKSKQEKNVKDSEQVKILKENNFKNINNTYVNKTFNDISILKEAINRCLKRNKYDISYLTKVYETVKDESVGNSNKNENKETIKFVNNFAKDKVRHNRHNDTVNNNFVNYSEDELEQILLESQRRKGLLK